MESIVSACEFSLCVSMCDLISWYGDTDHEFIANVELEQTLIAMGIHCNIKNLHSLYFESTEVGAGDIHVFRGSNSSTNVFVVNMYRELTDQLDLILIAIRCDPKIVASVLKHLRVFFDGASCQVSFNQSSYSKHLHLLLDESQYPKRIEESGYSQMLHYHEVN